MITLLKATDHSSADKMYEDMCPDAQVFPLIVMHENAGDYRFYQRTEHRKDGERYALASNLRMTMAYALTNSILGGDVWYRKNFLD